MRPRTNVQRGIDARVGGKTAGTAGEQGLALTIGPNDMPADVALLTGVPRIDHDNRHPCTLRFVLDKAAQLCKGPSRHSGALQLPVATDVDRGLREHSCLKAHTGGVRGRSVEGVHRGQQGSVLVGSGQELELQGKLHANSCMIDIVHSQAEAVDPTGQTFFPPRPEHRGFSEVLR